MFQILDEKGNCKDKVDIPEKDVKEMYRLMCLSRKFDEKAILLQRQGKLGTYAPAQGQEAMQVASAYLTKQEDWLFPTFREGAAYITKKIPLHQLLIYWNGSEFGQQFPKDINIFPISIPIASQIVHAAGCAWASKLKNEKAVTLAYFGDGATSEGDFHEAMNFGGVYHLPIVYICQNNHWAISVPRKVQTATKTLAEKAAAYGFEGLQVDGNDLFGCYKVAKDAIDKARSGGGPTMIEAVTYRMGVHTTSDDPTKYRDAKEVEVWKKRCPILRLKKYMINQKIWSEADDKKMYEAINKEIIAAVDKMQNTPKPDPMDMFKYVFAEIPQHLEDQMNYLESMLHEDK